MQAAAVLQGTLPFACHIRENMPSVLCRSENVLGAATRLFREATMKPKNVYLPGGPQAIGRGAESQDRHRALSFLEEHSSSAPIGMKKSTRWRAHVVAGLATQLAWTAYTLPVSEAITPPDLTVCNGVTCQDLPKEICSDGGFAIALKSYVPASSVNAGSATYVYEICSPPAGTCLWTLRLGEACLDNAFCQTKGQATDPTASCFRECAVNTFRGLSHFDAMFPNLANSTCVTPQTEVTGSCSAVDKNNDGVFPTVGNFVLGDSSCFASDSANMVAKCADTAIEPGDCIDMTLTIAGETTGLGSGAAIVVDKEATTCTATCMTGPSCDRCDDDPGPNHCLTRTLGFWGTHPWITNNYATAVSPVSVCGKSLDCVGPDDGQSSPSCKAGDCYSVMEGLGSNPGTELSTNQPYVSFVKQLTAAKLNLAATTALAPTGSAICEDWTYNGKTLHEWIALCEGTMTGSGLVGGLCSAGKSQISSSGCIEAFDAFNNSQDSGFVTTPPPFDRPSVDDHGAVSGADSSQFNLAQGKYTPPGKLVIGKTVGGKDCSK